MGRDSSSVGSGSSIWAVSSAPGWRKIVCFPRSLPFTMSGMEALWGDDAAREPAGGISSESEQARGDAVGLDGEAAPARRVDEHGVPDGGEAGEATPDRLVDGHPAGDKPRGIMDRLLAFFHRGKRDAAMRGERALGKTPKTGSSSKRGGLETGRGVAADGLSGDPVNGETGDPVVPRPDAGDSLLSGHSHRRIDDGSRAGETVSGERVDAGEADTPIAATTGSSHAGGQRASAVFDVANILPVVGDPRRPPLWLSRGLLQAAVAVTLTAIVWKCWPSVSWVFVDCVIALFIALAMEPAVARLESLGLNRRLSTLLVMIGLVTVVAAFIALFGGMLASQLADLASSLPSAYESLRSWVESLPTIAGGERLTLPSLSDAVRETASKVAGGGQTGVGLLAPIAGTAAKTASGLASGLMSTLTVIVTAYYASAYDVEARRAISRLIRPAGQERFQTVWEIVRSQVSGFLYSRGILAALNAAALSVFLVVLHVPYWLPLSIACGLVSQFVPTVGTYIGGALPCLSAAVSVGWKQAAAVLAFIVVYQQVENLALSPAVSRATLSLNPAVSLLAVMAGGSLAGALGAFLAIPVASSVKAILSQYAVAHGEEPGSADGGADADADVAGVVPADQAQRADART